MTDRVRERKGGREGGREGGRVGGRVGGSSPYENLVGGRRGRKGRLKRSYLQ